MKQKTPPSTDLHASTRLLKAFADPVRLRLPTVSRHLACLRRNGLVIGRKQGLWVYYRLARPKSGLHSILLGCLGTSLGDPEVFRQDQERLTRKIACCGEGD